MDLPRVCKLEWLHLEKEIEQMRLIFRTASAMFITVFPVIHNIVTLRKGLDDPRHRDPKTDKLLNIYVTSYNSQPTYIGNGVYTAAKSTVPHKGVNER